MAHYLLSVVTPTDGEPPAAEELNAIMKNVDTLHGEMRDAGVWVFSGGLDAPDTATVVRPRGDDCCVTDGPFVEAREYVGGIRRSSTCPTSTPRWTGAGGRHRAIGLPIEVRPFHWA